MQEEVLLEREIIEGYQLSPQQRRLWLLQQGEPNSPYRAHCAVRLAGDLEPAVLRLAVNNVVRRHDVLRTSFQRHPGVKIPVQVIADEAEPAWSSFDLTQFDSQTQRDRYDELYRQEQNHPLDLTRSSQLRLMLVKLSMIEHVLIIGLPTLCADAWTLDNLVKEISLSYTACVEGVEDWDEAAQYVQFSEWQNELLVENNDEGRAYWRKYDLSNRPTASLPLESRHAGSDPFRPDVLRVEVPLSVATKVEETAQQCGGTIAEFMSAAWHSLLWRLTGQTELDVARICSGRNYAELEDSVGLFAKWLPVRCHFSQRYQLSEIVRQIRDEENEGDDWQEYFIWPHRGAALTAGGEFPTFAFEYEEQTLHLRSAALNFTLDRRDVCIDRFKVKLRCTRQGPELALQFHYDATLFSIDTMQRLAGSFNALLARAVQNPEAPIANLTIVSAAEREQLLFEWNDTRAAYPHDKCLHELFEAQVERTPEAVATIFEEQRLTYAELNQRANQLAHYLRELGVGPETLVGLMMDRSLDLMIALLGILKAGGAYVPLDPDYPQDRLAFMAEDAGILVLLTQDHLVEKLPSQLARAICIDRQWADIARMSPENPVSGVTPESLIYAMYTSGSTGRPKGTMLAHRGIVNCLMWMQQQYQLSSADRFLLKGSLTFDASVWEAFWPLLTGAAVVVARPGGQHDGAYLVETIKAYEITLAYFVPPMLQVFLEEAGLETITSLRYVICGGESLPLETLSRFYDRLPAELHHSYGPTEASIAACEWTCQSEVSRWVVPMGRPLANTQLYVLDERLRLVPVGVGGELYIGGDGLARGYLRRPALTAERFIPNPFGDRAGARLYRTGDLVRYLGDGNLEFIGRTDDQVKLRGMRIELGEIEAVLGRHHLLKEVAVMVREDEPGHKQLVAYVVPIIRSPETARELREFLKQELPSHMIPSAFVVLDRLLPRMPSGKVDRRALPAPDRIQLIETASYAAPRTPAEEVLVAIWEGILPVERVGVHDTFFEMGGHSLMATQVMSRVREAFGVDLPLRAIFDWPTIEDMAEGIEQKLRGAINSRVKPIVPLPREGPFPLSFSQQRLWFLNQLDPDSAFYNIPIAVRLRGLLNVSALEQTLSEIVRRHEGLRTIFPKIKGQPAQVICPAVPVPLRVIDLSEWPETQRESEMELIISQEARRPFDLAKGPVMRANLIRLSKEDHVALFNVHHIVSDGWSTGILVKELSALYEAFSHDQPSPLAELSIQYADYASWQREWLQGEVLDTQIAYWRKQLEGAPATLSLPTDRPRNAVRKFAGATVTSLFPELLSNRLKELTTQEGVTLFMTLLAVFQALLYRYTRQENICVGTPIANRNHSGTENVIGFFVNMLVLRVDLSGNPTFRELLHRVRDVTLEAYAHQDLPFDKLVEELRPGRDHGQTPFFQVVFKLQDASTPKLELPELELDPVNSSVETMQFDLVLNVTQTQTARRIFTTLNYNTDLFDAGTMVRMLDHYLALLEGALEDPNQPLLDIPLTPDRAEELQPVADEYEQFVFN